MSRVLLSVLLSFAIPCLSTAENLRFSHITSNDGLSQSEVYSFLKDSQGYMWFGTVHGLNMFDGYQITSFLADNTDEYSLANSTIRDLAEDSYGRIWVATDSGVDCFDKVSRRFRSIALPSVIQSHRVSRLMLRDDSLFIGTNIALYVLRLSEDDNFDDIRAYSIPGVNGETWIRDFIASDDGTLYVGGPFGVVAIKLSGDNAYDVVKLPSELSAFQCLSIVRVSPDKILFGGQKGVFLYDEKSGKTAANGDLSSINSAVLDRYGYVWMSSSTSGLYKAEVEDGKLRICQSYSRKYYDVNSLSSNLISRLYLSDDDILWVGTIGNGVDYAKVDKEYFNFIGIPAVYSGSSYSTSFARSVYCKGDSQVYIGLHSNGLVLYDRVTGEYDKLGLDNDPVFDIKAFESDKLILCSNGLYELDARGRLRRIPGLDITCFNIEKGREGIYWVATWLGLYKLDVTSGWPYKITKSDIVSFPTRNHNNCRVLKYDREHSRLWVGTEGGGLLMIEMDSSDNPVRVTIFNDKSQNNAISNSYVRSLFIDRTNRLWVGTYDGLNAIDVDSDSVVIRKNYARESLANNVIQILIGDSSDNLWIGTNKGLTRLPAAGDAITYTVQDGLQSNEFSEHACCVSDTGELFFCGINGISYFNPSNISSSTEFPEATITSLIVRDWNTRKLTEYYDLEDALRGGRLVLNPHQNELEINLSAMVYDAPLKIRYKYFLEGYENTWNYTASGNRTVYYTNLSHGSYTFKVVASNTDGRWGEEATEMHFVIRTPLLISTPFKVLYLLLALLLVFIFMRLSVRRTTEREKLLLENDHNKRLHQLDMLRTKFFVNISHDLRTPLTLIMGPLEQIASGGKSGEFINEKVSQAYRNAKRLKYMVEQLLDFRKVEAGKEKLEINRVDIGRWLSEEVAYFAPTIKEKGLELRMSVPWTSQEVLMDCKKVSKILFNLISNAIKFTKKGYILVDYKINTEAQTLEITVKDSGKGISPESMDKVFERYYSEDSPDGMGYGIGLSHCKDLALSMNGTITAKSTPGKGSSFTLTIPLIYENVEAVPLAQDHEDLSIFQPGGKQSPVSLEPWSAEKKTVLVVDDNMDMRNYIAELLTGTYNVMLASDGSEGLKIAQSSALDIIISDVMMPGMSGLEMTQKLRTDINISHIPIILLSAKTELDTMLAGYEFGADDYVPKPFDSDIFLAKISAVLEGRERMRAFFQKGLTLHLPDVNIPDSDKLFIDKVIKLIEDNIDDSDYSINFMEKEMCMSHSKMFRKLKALTGMSGKELLQDVRLKRSAQLLRDTNLPISDVAYKTGFVDPKYFSLAFKKRYGMSPTRMREGDQAKDETKK